VVRRRAVPLERATGLVIRAVDFSETSRIATLWTREFGKVRVIAKGGRRPKGSVESALDLLAVYSMVLLRKGSGGLDLLTEARVAERFAALRTDLEALYAAYYVAELLSDLTEDHDPHPALFDEALAALRDFGGAGVPTGLRLLRFETVLLRELGYTPLLAACAGCRGAVPVQDPLWFSAAAGGVVCERCRPGARGVMRLSAAARRAGRQLADDAAWAQTPPAVKGELRSLFNQYVAHVLGRRPRTAAYLRS
jgi:DNA repair protein RecO (recombination protein O)